MTHLTADQLFAMSMNMASTTIPSELLQTLLTLEQSVLELLALNRPTRVLLKKMDEIQQAVVKISNNCVECFEWRKKLALWNKQFSQQMSPLEKLPINYSTNQFGVINEGFQKEKSSSSNSSSPLNGEENDVSLFDSEQAFDTSDYSSDSPHSSHSYDRLSFDEKKAVVLEDLKKSLSDLPELSDFSSVSYEVFENFIHIVYLVDYQMNSFWRQTDMQEELIEILMQKIPPVMREGFTAFYGTQSKSVRNFRRFLLNQIRIQLVERRGETKFDPEMECIYCRRTGHTVETCFERESNMCLKCFHMGHSKRRCPAKEDYTYQTRYHRD